MKIYLFTRTDNKLGYDTYRGFVVVAHNEEDAKDIIEKRTEHSYFKCYDIWPTENYVEIECIGTADNTVERGIVLSDFHAG